MIIVSEDVLATGLLPLFAVVAGLFGVDCAIAVTTPVALLVWRVVRGPWVYLMNILCLPVIYYFQEYDILSKQIAGAIVCVLISACLVSFIRK